MSNIIMCFLFIVILISFIGIPMGISPLYADVPDMNMSATPNPVGSGARALGIGGAFISVADDATAASWNPAGLLHLKKPEISLVGSHFAGEIDYTPSEPEWHYEDRSSGITRLNYLSAVLPFMLLRRNFVISFNYQHLYEFSMDTYSFRREKDILLNDIIHEDYKHQKGYLSTVSPALAIQIIPSLSVGLTCNFWDFTDNGWENLNIQNEKGMELGLEKISHSEIYEKYDFSGFNMHWGFLFTSKYHMLWGKERRFRIGGVLKTPFSADIRNEKHEIGHIYYTIDPVKVFYREPTVTVTDLTLKMPLSYGLGFSIDLSDTFSMALDIYRTHWEDYMLCYPTGGERSPINTRLKENADITPTTQVRMGVEYIIEKPGRKVPVRIGAFYDPEPASGNPDDFYGVSLGCGIIYKDLLSFDLAYQFRFGEKNSAEHIFTKDIPGRVMQHYFYASIIYYLF